MQKIRYIIWKKLNDNMKKKTRNDEWVFDKNKKIKIILKVFLQLKKYIKLNENVFYVNNFVINLNKTGFFYLKNIKHLLSLANLKKK